LSSMIKACFTIRSPTKSSRTLTTANILRIRSAYFTNEHPVQIPTRSALAVRSSRNYPDRFMARPARVALHFSVRSPAGPVPPVNDRGNFAR
jgi:hypothetical protein